MLELIHALNSDSAITRPARSAWWVRSSATYFVAVSHMHNPASNPRAPIVDCIIPTPPKASGPSILAIAIEDTAPNARGPIYPAKFHKAPRANLRPRLDTRRTCFTRSNSATAILGIKSNYDI